MAGFYVLEAHWLACALEFGEFVGVDEALDWQMLGRGLQILAEGEDVRALRGDFFHGGEYLVARFAEAEHHAGFCGQAWRHFTCAAQELKRALVDGAFADAAVEARHGFHVVIQHVGARRHHRFQRGPVAAKIWDEHFHPAAGDAFANLRDGVGENCGAAVGLIVAIHRSDDRVAQAHALDGFGDALRLVFLRRAQRLATWYGAKAAGARANIAEDHEGGGAMLPAFAHVGAARAFADGVEVKRAHDALQFMIIGTTEKFDAQPGRAWMRCRWWRRGGRQVRNDVKGRSHWRGPESCILRGWLRGYNRWAEWRGISGTRFWASNLTAEIPQVLPNGCRYRR